MKFSAQEEYGLRCLVTVARNHNITIPEIGRREGLTEAHVAKILMELRRGGYLESTRGQVGGYRLAREPETIVLGEVLAHLGGRLYDKSFCEKHTGKGDTCGRSAGCSIRTLWSEVQDAVDSVLGNITLADIVAGEEEEQRIQLTSAPDFVRGRS